LLVNDAVRRTRETAGVERIVGVTRPVDYVKHSGESIAKYIQRKTDPVLEFHRAGGALILAGYANYRPGDAQTNGYGVLIEYPLHV